MDDNITENRRNIFEVNEVMANHENVNSNNNCDDTNKNSGEDNIDENESGA